MATRARRADDGTARFHEATLLQPGHWSRRHGLLQRRVLRAERRLNALGHLTARSKMTARTGPEAPVASSLPRGLRMLYA